MKIEMTMSIENKDCGDNTEEITKETSKLVSKIKKVVFRLVMNQGKR